MVGNRTMRGSTWEISSTPKRSTSSCGEALPPTHIIMSSSLSTGIRVNPTPGFQIQVKQTDQINPVSFHEYMAITHQRWQMYTACCRVWEGDCIIQVMETHEGWVEVLHYAAHAHRINSMCIIIAHIRRDKSL
jgi:hypothetical protein